MVRLIKAVSLDFCSVERYKLHVSGNAFAGAPGTQHQAWLFANKPGVCKIGTYGGSGSMTREAVDCGFKPGLVIIKGDNSSR